MTPRHHVLVLVIPIRLVAEGGKSGWNVWIGTLYRGLSVNDDEVILVPTASHPRRVLDVTLDDKRDDVDTCSIHQKAKRRSTIFVREISMLSM